MAWQRRTTKEGPQGDWHTFRFGRSHFWQCSAHFFTHLLEKNRGTSLIYHLYSSRFIYHLPVVKRCLAHASARKMTCSRPWSLEMFASSLNFGKSEWIPQAQRCWNRQQMTWKEKNIEKWDCETFLQCSVLHQVQKEGNKCQQLDRKQRLQRVSNQKTKKHGEALTGAFFPQDEGLQTPTGSNWFLVRHVQKRSPRSNVLHSLDNLYSSQADLRHVRRDTPLSGSASRFLSWSEIAQCWWAFHAKKNAIHCDRIKNDRQDDATNICELYPSQYCRVHFLFTSLGFSAKQHISWAISCPASGQVILGTEPAEDWQYCTAHCCSVANTAWQNTSPA